MKDLYDPLLLKNNGQKGADFHSGKISVPSALSLTIFLSVLQPNAGGGTIQFFYTVPTLIKSVDCICARHPVFAVENMTLIVSIGRKPVNVVMTPNSAKVIENPVTYTPVVNW